MQVVGWVGGWGGGLVEERRPLVEERPLVEGRSPLVEEGHSQNGNPESWTPPPSDQDCNPERNPDPDGGVGLCRWLKRGLLWKRGRHL